MLPLFVGGCANLAEPNANERFWLELYSEAPIFERKDDRLELAARMVREGRFTT